VSDSASDSGAEIRVPPEALQRFACDALRQAGVPQRDAALVAGCLVEVDLRGIRSHGVMELGRYVTEYLEGQLNPTPEPRVARDDAVATVFDGDGGSGILVARLATERLIARAVETGLFVAATRNHGHVGSLGIYARMALRQNLITLSFAARHEGPPAPRPDATIWNAIAGPGMCIAIPSGGLPIVVDMNPNAFRDSRRLPAAMAAFPEAVIKSLSLRFAASLLGSTLPGQGGGDLRERRKADRKFPAATHGLLMLGLRPDLIGDADTFLADVRQIIEESRAMPPLPGLDRSDVPGSLESEREEAWSRLGIPLTERQRRDLEQLASELGVLVPWHE
jgi:LDH2 family malate/lactate/ureidoglycolate dehydrogenase